MPHEEPGRRSWADAPTHGRLSESVHDYGTETPYQVIVLIPWTLLHHIYHVEWFRRIQIHLSTALTPKPFIPFCPTTVLPPVIAGCTNYEIPTADYIPYRAFCHPEVESTHTSSPPQPPTPTYRPRPLFDAQVVALYFPGTSSPTSSSTSSASFIVRRGTFADVTAIASICEVAFAAQIKSPGNLRRLLRVGRGDVDLPQEIRRAMERKQQATRDARALRNRKEPTSNEDLRQVCGNDRIDQVLRSHDHTCCPDG